jgi:hypothetical protein
MLVVISDLHFTDGTTSNRAGGRDLFNVNPGAFRLFLSKIADTIERRRQKPGVAIKEVRFVYDGDIFDPLRTHLWFPINKKERPWSLPLNSAKVGKHAKDILTSILSNGDNAESLAWLSGKHPQFDEIWKVGAAIKRVYVPGNHDRILNLYPECRQLIHEHLLGRPGKTQRFRNTYLDQEHEALVMHGHEADSYNCEYGKNGEPRYDAVPIGDPMTTVLFSHMGRKAQSLAISKEAKERFNDIDNVRPTLSAIRYVQDIVKDYDIGEQVNRMVLDIVKEFKGLEYYREWNRKHDRFGLGYDEADKLQTALRAIEFLGTAVPAGLLEKLASLVGRDVYGQFAYARLKASEGTGLRYCILGHTHEPLHKPLFRQKKGNHEHHYLNTGTFRTTFAQTHDREDFLRLQRLSFVIIYGPREFSAKQKVPVYELWAGLRMHH